MPRLPDSTDLGPAAQSYLSGRPIAPGPADAVGPAVRKLGTAVTEFAGDLAQQRRTEQALDTATAWEQFQNGWREQARQAQDGMQPGGGGATADLRNRYRAAVNTFDQTVPAPLKPHYRSAYYALDGELTGQLGAAEAIESQRHAGALARQRADNVLGRLAQTPDDAAAWRRSYEQERTLIANDRRLTPIQKDALLADLPGTWASSHLGAIAGNRTLVDAIFAPPRPADRVWQRMLAAENASRDPAARSRAGALGLAQVEPATAREVARDMGLADVAAMSDAELHRFFATPEGTQVNLRIGRAYFDRMMDRFGDVDAAVVAYNGGPSRAAAWLNAGKDPRVLPAETRAYLDKVRDGQTPGAVPLVSQVVTAVANDLPPEPVADRRAETVVTGADGADMAPDGAKPPLARRLGQTDAPAAASDANTTAKRFVAQQWPDLPPHAQQSLAATLVAANDRNSQEKRASLEQTIQDATASIRSDGSYAGPMPSREDFLGAFGSQEGQRRYDGFVSAVDTGRAIHRFRTQSEAELRAQLEAAKPPAGKSTSQAQARYETLTAAATETLSARAADPAGYARQVFPYVRLAWEAAQQSPEAYTAALWASALAQAQLGIAPDKQRLLPLDMARAAATQIKDGTLPPAQRLEAMARLVQAMPAKEQQQAILRQLTEAGMPRIAGRALDALGRGDRDGATLLLAAATLDPGQLPAMTEFVFAGSNTLSGDRYTEQPVSDGAIDQAIQSRLSVSWDIASTLYGRTYNDPDDPRRYDIAPYASDRVLLRNATKILLSRGGVALLSATDKAIRSLYGSLTAIKSDHINAAVPESTDPMRLVDGLDMEKDILLKQAGRRGLVPEELQRLRERGIWRNNGDGLSLYDPDHSRFVPGEGGTPLIVPLETAYALAEGAVSDPAREGEPARPMTNRDYRVKGAQKDYEKASK
ncbi:transglycosylase SLT domain-containing protein [Labrys wisconsinensis]|uniref:Transglycosylase SLT domain-containing protein n=1 Tax=Labrys wisconsinensis TaxID=425677 RepID=A0ABU0JNQ6_9HYPH|nr:transglycosylase SLT domain-containing protein [Labrys wisconsinensis]MDQ0475018.1 hypothetical protein [Labrys wisconsinensis]